MRCAGELLAGSRAMNPGDRRALSLAIVCGSLLTVACATAPPRRMGPPSREKSERSAANTPTKEECTIELPALLTRWNRLERERARIHEKLAQAGFVRTSAEAIHDGTGAPGLALDAARSADALEQLLEGRTPAHPGLNAEIDWIAANWFDPGLMRWTPTQVRALTSMTTDAFREMKAETMALRGVLPDIASAKRRHAELAGCNRRESTTDETGSELTTSRPFSPRAAVSDITCSPRATTGITCQDTVVVEAGNMAAALRPLNSSSFGREELRGLGQDAAAWIAFARNAAGANEGLERIYVDGMPAAASVPASMIGRITVNSDPFSAEYSNVGEMRIDVELRAAERRWHADLSTPSFGAGGGSLLGPTRKPISRSTSMSVSGPVPRLPLTFSVQASRRFDERRPLFVAPVAGTLATAGDDVETTSSGADLVVSTAFVTNRAIVRATFSDSRLQADHAGIGGTNGPTTGQRLDSRNRRLQSSWRAAIGGRIHRGGVSFAQDRLSATADSLAPLVMITEQFITGGDELAANARQSDALAVKHVVQAGAGRWTTGVEGRTERVSDDRLPNPNGRIQFGAIDAQTATWIVSTGRSSAAVRTTSAALFAEQLTVNSPRMTVRSGLRLEWHNRAGAFLSPRVVGALRVSSFQLTGGAGLFVQALSPDLFVLAAERDGTRGATFVVHGVPAGTTEGIDPASGESLRTALAPGFAPRRDLVMRAGIQRRVGSLQTGIEHTWTRGGSLPGSQRERDVNGLVDFLSSDRALRRHQTYVSSSLRRGADVISAHYQHVWSFDDSDGPFLPPARRGDVGGEWARSAGVARHAAGVTGAAWLPGRIRLLLTVEARTGTAYTVLSGHDPEGLAVYTDRGGRPRNAGLLPPFRKVSVSAARTVSIPRARWLVFDIGVRADNLTNHLNVTSAGRIAGTPMFGLPVDAAAGRSIRFWASLAR